MEVSEFDLVTVKLTHDKTGAQHLHLARNDSNNAFGYLFVLCMLIYIHAHTPSCTCYIMRHRHDIYDTSKYHYVSVTQFLMPVVTF